ncbi:unnamed protein product [Diamesa hyperborea]
MIKLTYSLPSSNSKNTCRFTSVVCTVFNNDTINDHFCHVKAYSRSYSTLNFGGLVTKKLTVIGVDMKVEYKYGTVFREVISPPPIEWCSFQQNSNVFFSMIVDLVKDSAPSLIHSCPYYGRIDVYNLTINVNNFLSVFSQGDYRVTVAFLDNKIDMFKLVFGINNKSAIKSSFG